jgi:hypothetical protein
MDSLDNGRPSFAYFIDHIRPDWEAKLAAVQAAVTRRANRRIIMRQVGDRLIPVGVTSGRVHALSPEEAAAEGVDTGSRRNRRRQQVAQNQNFEQFMGMGGQDLEEVSFNTEYNVATGLIGCFIAAYAYGSYETFYD